MTETSEWSGWVLSSCFSRCLPRCLPRCLHSLSLKSPQGDFDMKRQGLWWNLSLSPLSFLSNLYSKQKREERRGERRGERILQRKGESRCHCLFFSSCLSVQCFVLWSQCLVVLIEDFQHHPHLAQCIFRLHLLFTLTSSFSSAVLILCSHLLFSSSVTLLCFLFFVAETFLVQQSLSSPLLFLVLSSVFTSCSSLSVLLFRFDLLLPFEPKSTKVFRFFLLLSFLQRREILGLVYLSVSSSLWLFCFIPVLYSRCSPFSSSSLSFSLSHSLFLAFLLSQRDGCLLL